MSDSKNTVSKKIWILWLQGMEKAPAIVKSCYLSWKNHNPDWEIILLDEDNLADYVQVDLPESKIKSLTPNGYANLIRLKLLIQYGGVWVDATTCCMKPLDEWLPENVKSGFFAFRNPGPDRLMSNWFLVSAPANYLTTTLYETIIAYWRDNQLSNTHKGPLITPFEKLFNRHARYTKYWFHPIITKVLRIFPYFNFHYNFTKLLDDDQKFKEIWQQTPDIPADIPHYVLHSKMLLPLSEQVKSHIDNQESPLYKLSWKYDETKFSEGCALDYLLKKINP
jgi:mannosyltransferase OCH1-like enzyme